MALDELSKYLPQVAENFSNDAHYNGPLLIAEKLAFEHQIDSFVPSTLPGAAPTAAQMARLVDDSCNAVKLRGPEAVAAAGRVLGTLRKRDRLEEDILRANPSKSFSPDTVESLLESILDASKPDTIRRIDLGLNADVLLRTYQLWSTYSVTSAGVPIPHAVHRPDLPCLLGLGVEALGGDFSHGQWVELSFRLHVSAPPAKEPTAFDAGSYPFWRPGGETKPLAICGATVGLPEVVHEAVTFGDLYDLPRGFVA